MGKKIGIGLVAAVMGFVILYGAGVINFGGSADPTNTEVPVGVVPAFVDQTDASWLLNPESKATSNLVIWEDPQCPACALFEAGFGTSVKKLIADDVVRVSLRPTTFLDRGYPGRNSARAVNAWACAIEGGAGLKFHDTLYANQPAKEGTGWTDEQLQGFGAEAGISGSAKTTFDKCVVEGTYYKWGVESTKMFDDLGVPGTPNISLDGVEMPVDVLKQGPAAFIAWVTNNAK